MSSAETKGRVLIADDSRVVRALVGSHLAAAGYEIREAADGNAALAALEQGGLDVVITDLNMPGHDGFEVLASAKKIAPGVEVIILTGAHSNDMDAAIRALRMGAHDYLIKPPSRADELLLTVERALEKKALRDTNQRLMRQLETLSLTDQLTGVPNRRAFDQALDQEAARAQRHALPLTVVILDIDHFKKVNDTYGHGGGDEVLRSFARVASGSLRRGDLLYRYGGEEFVALLPHADLSGGIAVAERLISTVAKTPVTLGSTVVQVTASAGVACLGSASPAETLSKADAALYEAKRSGRNRVCATKA